MESSLLQYSHLRQRYQKVLNRIQFVCRDILQHHPIAAAARDYLNSRVSSSNQEIFSFGYFPNDDNLDIIYERISKKLLEDTGLIYPYHVQNGDQREFIDKAVLSDHNLTLPYRDIYGNIISLMGRTILSELERKSLNIQKYKYVRGPAISDLQFKKSLHLFGIDQAVKSIIKKNSVIVVEGQLDCITCHEFGIHNVVALGGAHLTKYQFSLLRRLTHHICLLLDNDAEGQKAQNKIINRHSELADIDKLVLPDGYKDIDQYLRDGQKFGEIKC